MKRYKWQQQRDTKVQKERRTRKEVRKWDRSTKWKSVRKYINSCTLCDDVRKCFVKCVTVHWRLRDVNETRKIELNRKSGRENGKHMQSIKTTVRWLYNVKVRDAQLEINDSIRVFLFVFDIFSPMGMWIWMCVCVCECFIFYFIESIPSRCFVFSHAIRCLWRLKQFLLNCFVVGFFFPFFSSFSYLFKRKVSFKLLPAFVFFCSSCYCCCCCFPFHSFVYLFFLFVWPSHSIRPKWTNQLTWRLQSFTMQYRENLKPITIFHCRQKW